MKLNPSIVCAWCSQVITLGTWGHGISHGCCQACESELNAEVDAIAVAAGVELPAPVVVVIELDQVTR